MLGPSLCIRTVDAGPEPTYKEKIRVPPLPPGPSLFERKMLLHFSAQICPIVCSLLLFFIWQWNSSYSTRTSTSTRIKYEGVNFVY